MKFLLLATCLTFSGCTLQRITPMTSSTPNKVSQLYTRAGVKAYETYNPVEIAEHRFALMHLKSGESFPMLCRETPKGIYPIPQTVMSNAAYDQWTISARPNIGQSPNLATFRLSQHDGALFLGKKALPPAEKNPALIQPPVPPAGRELVPTAPRP